MASAGKIIASALLGGTKQGTEGFVDQQNKFREFAIQELAAKPSSAKTFEYYQSLPDVESQGDFLNTLAASSGYYYQTPKGGKPKKFDIPSPRVPSYDETARKKAAAIEAIPKDKRTSAQKKFLQGHYGRIKGEAEAKREPSIFAVDAEDK